MKEALLELWDQAFLLMLMARWRRKEAWSQKR